MSFHEICLPVLLATLLPRLLLWVDPFREECPDLQDVGLYFFLDDNIARSRETYALLLEVMDTQNSVMRIYFDGVDAVDLLIFTSKQLHLDSLNTVTSPSTENFLWGIFRDKNHCPADMYDNGTTVDMEVDMAGGKMVGTVDVVVPKDSSTPCRRPEPIMKAVQQLLTIKKEEHSSYLTRLRVLDSTIKQLLAFNSEEPIMKDEHSASTDAYLPP
ncbi:uncharacterized protein LOC133708064 isoform X2 [Rosa rugosa]|uniref:uncharacterized protein LOC133708064 isoform X2 n=1 Tax=Rosa rugosa TaxID=74645 RepID=UPI002B4185C0|nr:uncharacterized protein LOC133708064 isoform X2 [Rosa rugosa]